MMKKYYITIVLIIPLLSKAQVPDKALKDIKNNLFKQQATESFAPTATSSAATPVSSLKFLSAQGESSVEVGLGLRLGTNFSTNVSVSSPLNKSGVTKPVGLDGIPNDGKFTVGFQFTTLALKNLTESDIRNTLTGFTYDDNGTRKKVSAYSQISNEEERNEVINRLEKAGKIKNQWFVGSALTISKKEFSYAMDNTLSEVIDEQRQSLSISGNLGFYFNTKTLLRAVFLYKNYYKANASNDFLIPFDGGPNLIKRNLAIGNPNEIVEKEVKIENVTNFNITKIGDVGINPSITILVDSKEASIDFPFYFIGGKGEKEKNLGLNTGIYLNYTTGQDEPLSAGVFVGSSLNGILNPQKN